MGIKDLFKVIKINEKIEDLKYLQGKTVGVDISGEVNSRWYKAYREKLTKTNIFNHTEPDENEIMNTWLQRMLGFVDCLREQRRAKVVIVFDGAPPEEKKTKIDKRREERQKLKKKIDDMYEKVDKMDPLEHDDELMKKLMDAKGYSSRAGEFQYNCLKKLLIEKGYVCYQAEQESDRLLAALALSKTHPHRIDVVWSKDSDLLTYGCPEIIKGYVKNERKQNIGFSRYNLQDILTSLELNMKQFVDLCILLGCDYGSRPKKQGPVTALKNIKKYEKLEDFDIDITCSNYEASRKMFKITDPDAEILRSNIVLFDELPKKVQDYQIRFYIGNVVPCKNDEDGEDIEETFEVENE